MPYVFKFRLVPRKEVLEDGTVVTLVSQLTGFCMGMFSVGRPGLTEGSVFPGEGDKEYGKVMRDARDEELFCKWIILGIATDAIRF